MFGQRACDLLREVAVASADALPAYNVRCCANALQNIQTQCWIHNQCHDIRHSCSCSYWRQDEMVRLVVEELQQHHSAMLDLIRC
jgi:hypothetical protein